MGGQGAGRFGVSSWLACGHHFPVFSEEWYSTQRTDPGRGTRMSSGAFLIVRPVSPGAAEGEARWEELEL